MNLLGGKILLCEDDGLIALELQSDLEACGYEVTGVAGNGADAIVLAKTMQPDIALMDIGLQGAMSGIEVASWLRRSYDIPSIFLTGHTDSETFSAAKSTDPYGFLIKPVDPDHLRRTIDLAIQLHTRERALRTELRANLEQVDHLLKTFPSTREEDGGRGSFGAIVRIAGGSSHHLNNMLFAVQGNLEWLAACPTVGSHEKRYIAAALEACSRAGGLIKKLSWTAGQGKFQMKIISADEILTRAVEDLKWELRCDVVVRSGDYKLLVGEEMVIEAVRGLIRNASEASAPGQKIYVTASRVSAADLPARPDGINERDCICIEVKDEGKGIPSSFLGSAVEPFVTSHDLVERVGLGLSVARGVCFAHDGWFTVSSVEGTGTTVQMFLPLAVEASIGGDVAASNGQQVH